MKNSYLITGVAGFIGSESALALLRQGHNVIGIDDLSFGYQDNVEPLLHYPNFEFIKDSILNVDFLSYLRHVDYVLHFAGISSLPECESQPELAYNVNVLGTLKLLKSARGANVKRILFASTSAVYENSGKGPFSEECPVNPDLIYSQTKLAAEMLCHSFHRNYGLDVVIGRFFNVYGPHQDFRRPNPPFTSYLIREVMHNRNPVIFNTGDFKRDYIYIEDLIRILFGLLHKRSLQYLTYNLTSGDSHSPKEIFDHLMRIMKTNLKSSSGSPMDFWAKYATLFETTHPLSIERIKKEIEKVSTGLSARVDEELGLQSFKSLPDGLKEILRFQQNEV